MSNLILSRRKLLTKAMLAVPAAGLMGTAAWAQAAPLTPTPRQTEGPFYPRSKPTDIDNDLAALGDTQQVAQGELLTVRGRVLDQDGNHINGARVEFWHCDIHGTYHHVGADTATDKHFQGYGEMITGGEGYYDFRTIKPGIYPGRARHIHFKVIAPGRRTLTSQMYFDSDMDGNMKDGIYRRLSEAGRKAVTMQTRPSTRSNATMEGLLDIVIT